MLAIGIIGATVMPHGLFLGSQLATQDRVSDAPKHENSSTDSLDSETTLPVHTPRTSGLTGSLKIFSSISRLARHAFRSWKLSQNDDVERPTGEGGHASWENKPLSFVRAHLKPVIADMVISLLGFAVAINAL